MNRLLIALFLCSGIALGQTTVPFVIVPAVPSNPNLITNSSFTTDVTGWSSRNSATLAIASGGQTGNCLHVTNGSAAWGQAEQALTLTNGVSYTLTFWYKAGTARCYAIVADNGGTTVAQTADLYETSWTSTSLTFAATGTMRVWLGVGYAVAGDDSYFDDVSVTAN